MAKLAIYRGETLEREIDLTPRTARIGRGDQNDIVLPDPAKSVSRFHAELRYDNGRYTLVDLNSQNGTWVAGKRVSQTVLEPGVPVVVGTYRLVLAGQAPVAADAEKTMISGPAVPSAPPAPRPAAAKPEAPPAAAPVAKKDEAKPSAQAAPPPEAPKPAAAPPPPAPKPAAPPPPPPAKAAPPPPPPPAKPAPPPAPPKPAPAPAPAAAAAKPTAPKAPGKGLPRAVVYGGLAALVIAAVAAGFFLWKPASQPAGSPAATTSPAEAGTPAADATPTAQAAAPVTAPAQQPTPAGPPTTSEAPPKPAVQRAEAVTAPRAATPRAADAGGGAAGTVPGKKAARRGAEPPAPAARPRDLGTLLSQARSAMINGDYITALTNLEAIVKVDPNYQDAGQMLGMARSGAKNAAQLAIDSGTKAEMAGDYDTAVKHYEQALLLDPGSQAVADAQKRLRARMQADGEDAFKRARQFDALGRSSDAIGMYEKAIKLLPADHPSAKTAKERLTALRGGN